VEGGVLGIVDAGAVVDAELAAAEMDLPMRAD
jgi:hypothetical protein